MSLKSQIEWTDATWNPVRGCTKVSAGCAHCYAETFAERFRGVPGHPYEHGFDLRLVPAKLVEPITWGKSKMIFVNSMSDLFHEDVPDEFIEAVARVMTVANWHVYQILTKRSERLRDLLLNKLQFASLQRHIWWGVSVENRKVGIPRIEHLRKAKPAMAFLSIEPLLEDIGEIDFDGIQWVIVGGESGPGARPMRIDWVRGLKRQCMRQKIPFFFKQWGGVRKGDAGRRLDGRTYDETPEVSREIPPAPRERRRIESEFTELFAVRFSPSTFRQSAVVRFA
jgi:protein gp37